MRNVHICIIDPLSPYGHRDLNKVLIRLASEIGTLTVVCARGLIGEKLPGVEYILYADSYFKIGKNSLDNRRRLLWVLKKMCDFINTRHFDVIMFTSYEIITTYIAFNVCRFAKTKDKKIYLLNHSNIDEVTRSKVKQFCYRRLRDEMVDLCYEEYIGRYIEETYDKKWCCMRHNVNDFKLEYKRNHVSEEIAGFFESADSLSGHMYVIFPGEMFNEEKIIQEIHSLEKSSYLREKKIKIFVKNKKYAAPTDNVLLWHRYLNDDEYSYIFEHCHYVGIIYNPSDYVYRSSGIFFDAATFKKPIIYCKTLFFDDKVERFGDIGLEYSDSLKACLDNISQARYGIEEKHMESVYGYYSDINVLGDLNNMIGSE